MFDLVRRLALAFALVATPALAAGPDPLSGVAPLYAKGHKALNAATSRDLAALWTRCDKIALRSKDEMGPLDFDPVTNSQLGFESVKGQTLKIVSQDEKHAEVDVTLAWKADVGRGADRKASDDVVRYTLVPEKGGWRIDDVRSTVDGKEWSLRKILADYVKADAK